RLVGPEAFRLTDAETIDLGEVGSRVSSSKNGRLLVQNRSRGRVELVRVTSEGTLEPVLSGDVTVNGHAIAGETIVVSISTPTSMGELAVIRDGIAHVLTDFGSAIAGAGIFEPIELTVTARDG